MTVRPVLVLVLLTTVLPELLSGSTPAEAWAAPAALPFLALAYGIPVLALREIAVRGRVGAAGLFVMGLGYGIVNEGLLAGTIFRETGVPIELFDGYGRWAGVGWPWAFWICAWHAVSSVWLPIALTERAHGRAPWLGRAGLTVVALLALAWPSLVFLMQRGAPGLGPFAAQWAVILALVALGSRLAGGKGGNVSWLRPLAFGALGGVAFLAALVPVAMKAPPPAQVAVLAALLGLWAAGLGRWHLAGPQPVGWLALGWYGFVALFSATYLYARSPLTLFADAVALLLIWLWVRSRPEP